MAAKMPRIAAVPAPTLSYKKIAGSASSTRTPLARQDRQSAAASSGEFEASSAAELSGSLARKR
jgi:hypothetical protein